MKILRTLIRFFNISSLSVFKIGLKHKIILLPVSYYIPIANILALAKSKSWRKKTPLSGIIFNTKEQIRNLKKIMLPFINEYKDGNFYENALNEKKGLGYGAIEAQALYGVIRAFKPKKIIEIGSGISTHCMIVAGAKNITCIEPFPSNFITNLNKTNKKIKLIKKKVQKVDTVFFKTLSKNDILFIDSSHTLTIDSDITKIYLEILPVLKKGVIIQIHDIFFPYNYQRDANNSTMQWMETQLLQAFLINNKNIEIIFSMSYLHYEASSELKKVFPIYKPHKDVNGIANSMLHVPKKDGYFPSSIYLRVK